MTKSELIDKIASSAGISRTAANNALTATMDNIVRALKKGQKVTLIGFGTFAVSERKGRTARHPKTGETIKIPSVRIPRFTASKVLKNSIK